MEEKRVGRAKQSGERERIEERRFEMELYGVELQWSSSEQISIDLQWHGIGMPRYGEKINERG